MEQPFNMHTFSQELLNWPPEKVRRLIASVNDENRVDQALSAKKLDKTDFAALLSPAASLRLEPIARRSALLTRQRFGNTLQFYAPLYVSNHCVNSCLYCGFNRNNNVMRRKLSIAEAEMEAAVLAEQGFRHLLLVSGEDRKNVPVEYFEQLARTLKNRFASIAIEIYPLDEEEYHRLVKAGIDSLTLYQETYQTEEYAKFHPAGPKKDFQYRLAAIERGARAGIPFLGIGALLGLADWRLDGFYTGLHAKWLLRHYWRSHVSISFPRLRQASGAAPPSCQVDDAALVQLITAQRIFLPEVGLVLSTREKGELRDNLLPLGITRLSAGSKTSPGGYCRENEGEPQFAVQDHRSLRTMRKLVLEKGFDPVNKDWDHAYHELP